MPTHKSTTKSMRQDLVRHQRNVAQKSRLKTAMKRVLEGVKSGDVAVAKEALTQAVPIIDKTCSKGVIHKNKAARHKSRLTHRLNTMTAKVEGISQEPE